MTVTSETNGAAAISGTWRLVEATAVDAEGRALPPPYGPVPTGRLILTDTGRMMSVLCDGRPQMPDGEKRAYASYCGNFRIEGDRFITTIDAAAIESRVGSQSVREFEFRGHRLVLRPPARPDGERRELLWERDGRG